jgi:hypothetical protein
MSSIRPYKKVKGFRLYDIWCGMRQRCRNPKNKRYVYYGAKGVKVCEEWENFDSFFKWAVGNGYADNLVIDRINSNSDYCPGNCRWITGRENTIRAHKGTFQSDSFKKSMSNRVSGSKNPMARPVVCIETGKVFPTGREASLSMGMSVSAVGMAVIGKCPTSGGFHWRYA